MGSNTLHLAACRGERRRCASTEDHTTFSRKSPGPLHFPQYSPSLLSVFYRSDRWSLSVHNIPDGHTGMNNTAGVHSSSRGSPETRIPSRPGRFLDGAMREDLAAPHLLLMVQDRACISQRRADCLCPWIGARRRTRPHPFPAPE